MKRAVVLIQAAAVVACSSGLTITVAGSQWSTREASKCLTSDSLFEYTRVSSLRSLASTPLAASSSAAGCIQSCVAGRKTDVTPAEECRFVQFAVTAGTVRCTSYYFRLDQAVLGKGMRGCTTTSDTVYHPRYKLVVELGPQIVGGSTRDVEARNAQLLGTALRSSVLTDRNVDTGAYTAVQRGWWGSPNNQCVGRVTSVAPRSATLTEHRQRSGPEYYVNSTVVWTFDGVFVNAGASARAGKGGNGLLYGYDNFVKPMIQVYTRRSVVLPNNRVDDSIVPSQGVRCPPRGGSCSPNGIWKQTTRSDQDMQTVPAWLSASFFDLANENSPKVLATMTISSAANLVTNSNIQPPRSPLCKVSDALGATNDLVGNSATLLELAGVALSETAGGVLGVVGLGVWTLGFICDRMSAAKSLALDPPMPVETTAEQISANVRAYCNVSSSAGDQEWCDKRVFKPNAWFERYSVDELQPRIGGDCETLDDKPIVQLVADAPEGATHNVVLARDACKAELKAFDDMVAAQEAEIKRDNYSSSGVTIALSAGAGALLILSARAVVVVRRRRSSSPTTALAATEQLTVESML